MIALPSQAEATAHLRRLLARGTVNLGAAAGTERLMLMVTRSCHLRCGYCFVAKTETGPSMPRATARRAVDLLMRSARPKLELQLFGGEPTARPDLVEDVLTYASAHPARAGRDLRFVLTTNGLALDEAALALLAAHPVTVLLSLDGDQRAQRRHRPVHRGDDASFAGDDDAAWARVDAAIDALSAAGVSWFMNAVIPPSAADEVVARYAWAVSRGVPALQLNYAVGMRWDPPRAARYLAGLAEVLVAHHGAGEPLRLFNWGNDCEPVMLSDDLIVDVDGAVLHDAAIFLERRFPALRARYLRGHVDALEAFDPLRWSVARLFEVMVETFPQGSEERRIVLTNAWLGAASDLVVARAASALGRPPSRGAAALSPAPRRAEARP